MSPQPRGALSDAIRRGGRRNRHDVALPEPLQPFGLYLPAGRGARSAVGVTALPFGIPVEIEAVVQIGR